LFGDENACLKDLLASPKRSSFAFRQAFVMGVYLSAVLLLFHSYTVTTNKPMPV
jgi:hypothetical protein